MGMNQTITDPAASPVSEERGFDPFASLPETPIGQPVDQPEEGAPEAATPDPIAELRAELAARDERLATLEQERMARQAEQQQAQMGEFGAQWNQGLQRMQEVYQTAAIGLPAEERAVLDDAFRHAPVGKLMAMPQVQQALQTFKSGHDEYQRLQATEDLIAQHFGHNLSSARFKELRGRLMKAESAASQQELIRAIAEGQRRQNLESGVGNPRVEGPGNGGYTPALSEWDRYQKALREGGPLPSAADIDRMTRSRFFTRG